jgi:hypothetical protein
MFGFLAGLIVEVNPRNLPEGCIWFFTPQMRFRGSTSATCRDSNTSTSMLLNRPYPRSVSLTAPVKTLAFMALNHGYVESAFSLELTTPILDSTPYVSPKIDTRTNLRLLKIGTKLFSAHPLQVPIRVPSQSKPFSIWIWFELRIRFQELMNGLPRTRPPGRFGWMAIYERILDN